MSKNIKVVKIDNTILPFNKKNRTKKTKKYSHILSSPKKVKELLCLKQTQMQKKGHTYEFKDTRPSKILSMINGKKSTCLSGDIPETVYKKIEKHQYSKPSNPIQKTNVTKLKKSETIFPMTRKFTISKRRNANCNRLRSKLKTRRKYSSKTIDEFINTIKNSQTKNKKKQFTPEKKKTHTKKQELILKTLKYILRKGNAKLLSEYIKKMNKRQAIFILKRLNIDIKQNTPTTIVKNILLNTLSTNIRIIKY